MSSLQMVAARPYFVLLASATASSWVRKLIATSTGPKISSVTSVLAGETLVTSAGFRKQPLPGQVAVGLVDHRAFGGAALHQIADALDLHRGDQRADVDGLVERIADAEGRHARLELGDEALLDRLLHEEARAGAADLALVEPDGVDEALDGAVEIGVLEDDVGRLAAELEAEALAGAGGGLADDLADLGRAGEGDLVDIGMIDDRGAGARPRR